MTVVLVDGNKLKLKLSEENVWQLVELKFLLQTNARRQQKLIVLICIPSV
jgi:hypothetical protein